MTDETVFVVVGVNQYHEDGFGLGKVFESEQAAEDYIENEDPSEAMRFGYSRYYAKELPFVTEHD